MQYLRLDEKNRQSRRTIADALEVLRREASFGVCDRALVRSRSFRLPSTEVAGVVQVIFDPSEGELSYVVSLPTSSGFYAKDWNSLQRAHYDIGALDGAEIDELGNGLLTDGTKVRAIELIPSHLPLDPTELDVRILHGTLMHSGAEQCYRSVRDDIPGDPRVPDLRGIDYSRLSGLNIPSLESIAAFLAERHPALPVPSPQTISNALRKFGVRLPKARRK